MQTYEKENIIEKLIALVVNIDKEELLSKKDKKEIIKLGILFEKIKK